MAGALKKSSRSRSANRLNKFIRSIFKIESRQASPAAKLVESAGGGSSSEEAEEQQGQAHGFTFTRLFSSFRGSHASISGESKRVSRAKRNANSTNSTNSTSSNTNESLKTLQVNGKSFYEWENYERVTRAFNPVFHFNAHVH